MAMWFKYQDIIWKDMNEDECLSYYCDLDEINAAGTHIDGLAALTKATQPTDTQLTLKELYTEARLWLWKLGYVKASDRGDKVVWYSALDHFLMHGQEIPAVIGDKFDIDFTIDASHIFCNPIRPCFRTNNNVRSIILIYNRKS